MPAEASVRRRAPARWSMRIKLAVLCLLLPAHLEYLLFPIALQDGGARGVFLIAYPVVFAMVALRFAFASQTNFERAVATTERLLEERPELVTRDEELRKKPNPPTDS